MYDFTDLNVCHPTIYNKGSIMDVINSHPDFSLFSYACKTAGMDIILDNIQADFTILVPSNEELKKKNLDSDLCELDIGTARCIVNSSLINRRIPSEIMRNSPAFYLITMSVQNRLFVTNINDQTRINNDFNIIHFDAICTNGIIHVVDGLIKPLQI
jgi:uncharacterized surface protein with fasciclin (FAS1) repeats